MVSVRKRWIRNAGHEKSKKGQGIFTQYIAVLDLERMQTFHFHTLLSRPVRLKKESQAMLS